MGNIELKPYDKSAFEFGFGTFMLGVEESGMHMTDDVVDCVVELEKQMKKFKQQYEHLIQYYDALLTDIDDDGGELTQGFENFKKSMNTNIELQNQRIEYIKTELTEKIEDFKANYEYTTKSLEISGGNL